MKKSFTVVFFLCCIATYAQTTVTGRIVDNNNSPVLGANILVPALYAGTVSDVDGNFSLTVSQDPPFTLQISSVGFETVRVPITSSNQIVDVTLLEGNDLDEIVVSASRTPERIFESPVTVERFGIKEIKNTTAATFYAGLENLKGVDINTSSLTFQSVNTRGFATFANTRFCSKDLR